VRKLRDLFGLTIVMITHDLDLLWQVADRVAVLAEGKVQGIGSMSELSRMEHPAIRKFFDGRAGERPGTEAEGDRRSSATARSRHRNQSELCVVGAFVLVLGARLVAACSGSPRAARSSRSTTCTWRSRTSRWPAST
jgi:ABC-type glutathione transport system ATPase component